MKETKFRAYIKAGYGKGMSIDLLGYTLNKEKTSIRYWYIDNAGRTQNHELIVRNVAIVQFTGLKDKNGKEIYEGDVVNIAGYGLYNKNDDGFRENYTIEDLQEFFEEKGYAEGELGQTWSSKNFEVISNIHENQELTN